MEKKERRRYTRCNQDTRIFFSIFNSSAHHEAVARNYSGFGMYFESDRSLSPGTVILIKTLGCDDPGDREAGSFEGAPVPYYCRDFRLSSEACRDLKSIAVAEVRRCEICRGNCRGHFGISVQYAAPPV